MNPTPERTEKKDGGAQARPFPFPLTLVERERDGSCYFVSSPDGKLDARHKRLVVFEVGCATDHAKHIEICVNSHADLVAQNEALRGALRERERAIWRTALTLAHNICVQDSDRFRDEDANDEAHACGKSADRIRSWVELTDEQMAELFAEGGVPEIPSTTPPQ